MRIKLLLDEHLDPEVVVALRRQFPGLNIRSIHNTAWGGMPDPALLEVLEAEGLTLVTRDVNSMPGHVRQRLATGGSHAGVIYVDNKRLRQLDRRGLIRRLSEVVKKYGNDDWRCREGWL